GRNQGFQRPATPARQGTLGLAPRGARRFGQQRRNAMGLLSFIKDAGEKLFGRGEAQAAQKAAEADASAEKVATANAAAAKAIEDYIASMKLGADGLQVDFDGANSTVTVSGTRSEERRVGKECRELRSREAYIEQDCSEM